MLQATGTMIKLLCEAIEQDDDLCSLQHIVQTGWPSQFEEVPLEIQPYQNFHEESTAEDGLFIKGQELSSLQAGGKLFQQIHTSHIGLSECLTEPSKPFTSLTILPHS